MHCDDSVKLWAFNYVCVFGTSLGRKWCLSSMFVCVVSRLGNQRLSVVTLSLSGTVWVNPWRQEA